MANNKFYITTSIPYVNGNPHLGHVLEYVQADVIARYMRSSGKDVFFSTGTDENSLKNVLAAEKEGITTKDLVDRNSAKFLDTIKKLNISNDCFIRTTEDKHIGGAEKLWNSCKKEDIYKKQYSGKYCVGCETFVTEKDLIEGKCPEHDCEPEIVEEENYFFKLTNYQKQLEDIIDNDKIKIYPESRKNEVLNFIKSGLEDFSISRSVKRAKGWGIKTPGDDAQIIYVWFDALINYITVLDYVDDGELYKKYWPAELHCIGKNITRFHAVYWPAMLLSAGIKLPKAIFVHGFINAVGGQKMSKTLGNVIDPPEIISRYGADALRYYLLREIPTFKDGDFSWERFDICYNELANGLGNLVSRVTNIAEKNNIGFVDVLLKVEPEDENLSNDKLYGYLDSYQLDKALEIVRNQISNCNLIVATEKPWEMKENKEELILKINIYLNQIKNIGINLSPFMPETSEKILKIFNGEKIVKAEPLFPKNKEIK